MVKLRCQIKAKAKKLKLALTTRGLYSRYVFTAEEIPYQEHGHYNTIVAALCKCMLLLYFIVMS